MRALVGRLLVGIVATASLAACAPKADLRVDGAWVRLPAVPGRPGAAYFTLHGGKKDAVLVSVSSRVAERAELHESASDASGMMQMRAIANVPVPAGGEVRFAPGGRHVMLFGLDPKLRAGERTSFTLHLADGRTVTASADIVGPGATP
ncbi:copper chaperone PCu(A)C [Sphingomonas sp. RS6]